MKNEPEKKQHLVCAIYTRKSTSEGLDQEFSSLDNQRESAENYIKSQQHEGWSVSPTLYDDGGFTGANIERPALQNLLNDIKAGKINCVVVYKVDRLSRSLLDFTQLLEFFDKNNVFFVSVTQSFNTNTSMGRLTLNILLSFAQFEREIISERTKDKMGAARRRGQWLGGRTPFGYRKDEETKKLIIDPEEAATVRKIFDLYLKGNSALAITKSMNLEGYLTRSFTTRSNKVIGNKPYTNSRILYILKNHIYVGKVHYEGKTYDGQQPAIIDEDTFLKVQRMLAENKTLRVPQGNTECAGLLTRILTCKDCGTPMIQTYSSKEGKHKYRYYVCNNAQKRGYAGCPNKSIPAQLIEDDVIERLKIFVEANKDKLSTCKIEADALISPVWETIFPKEKARIIGRIVKKIDCNVPDKRLGFTFHDIPQRQEFESGIRRALPHSPWRKERAIEKEPKIRRTLILAYQLQQSIENRTIASARLASSYLHLSQSRVNHVLNMLMLSPTIQEEIINGDTAMLDQIPEYKVRELSFEIDWNEQGRLWQEAKK